MIFNEIIFLNGYIIIKFEIFCIAKVRFKISFPNYFQGYVVFLMICHCKWSGRNIFRGIIYSKTGPTSIQYFSLTMRGEAPKFSNSDNIFKVAVGDIQQLSNLFYVPRHNQAFDFDQGLQNFQHFLANKILRFM